jgi:hypothetical protein
MWWFKFGTWFSLFQLRWAIQYYRVTTNKITHQGTRNKVCIIELGPLHFLFFPFFPLLKFLKCFRVYKRDLDSLKVTLLHSYFQNYIIIEEMERIRKCADPNSALLPLVLIIRKYLLFRYIQTLMHLVYIIV